MCVTASELDVERVWIIRSCFPYDFLLRRLCSGGKNWNSRITRGLWRETPAGLLSDLAERIVRLDEDSERRVGMSSKARSHVREFFDAPRLARQMVEVYQAVCRRHRRDT